MSGGERRHLESGFSRWAASLQPSVSGVSSECSVSMASAPLLCVISDRSLHFPEPQFPYLEIGNNKIFPEGLLQGLGITYVKQSTSHIQY